MGAPAVGDVVLIAFPYADFSAFKKRPALVVGKAEFDNLITCQITSKPETSKRAIKVTNDDILGGSLQIDSYIRPDKIFTVELSVLETKVGSLNRKKLASAQAAIRDLFR